MTHRPFASKIVRVLPAAAVALVLVASSAARANTIQIDFTGIVAIVPTALRDGTIEVGATVSGSVAFATDPGPNTYPNPGVGRYEYVDAQTPIRAFDVSIASHDFSLVLGAPSDPWNQHVEVLDDYPFVPQDALFVSGNMAGDAINGLFPGFAQFGLVSSDLARIDGVDVPSRDEIAGFLVTEGTLAANFLSFGGTNTIRWNLTSFEVAPVPEPSGELLFCVGLTVAGLCRRRRGR